MDLEDQIALVTATWTPEQQLHAGNVAWHGAGCDGAPPCDVVLEGDGWFVEAWISTASNGSPRSAEIDGHFSPRLSATQRHKVLEQVHALAPNGSLSLETSSAMADSIRNHHGEEQDGPYFLLQHRSLDELPDPVVPRGYTIVPAAEAGDEMRVAAHQTAWDPRRIKTLLGFPITGNEPPSSFSIDKYQRMKRVSIYRPELDLMVLAADGSPAAFALGWLDPRSRSVLFEPVGTAPEHGRRGLSAAVCTAIMIAASGLGATRAVVGPRGDDAYPLPNRLYTSLGFRTLTRTTNFTWRTS